MTPTEKIWHNGRFIRWEDARIHVLSHVVSYGSSVFEGIRCYATPNGPAIFRLAEHARRFVDSAKIYRITEQMIGFDAVRLAEAMVDLVAVNRMKSCYIRPIMLRGYGDIGVMPKNNPIETFIACWDWGKYLGAEALAEGVDVCVSSWNRNAPNTMPTLSKAGGNYLSSQLIRMEADVNGYSEGIALDVQGYVSEGSGENIFVIRGGKIYTPPLAAAVLPGITRDTLMTLARDHGFEVVEGNIPREVFFTGTAAEVTPVRSIDRYKIGSGSRGPITKVLQDDFFAIVSGQTSDRHGWLTHVPALVAA
jgi:branched-chain amino acid aminotransferase